MEWIIIKIEANGISIHYEFEGDRNGPFVILSHSLAAHLSMWNEQVACLSPHFRVLRYDTRGHGQTEAPAGDYTLELLANDLFALMDELNIDTAHFVGLSMGGMIGQTAVLQNQSRFLSLSLCDTSSHLPLETLPMWEQRIALATAEGMETMVESTIDRWFSTEFQEQNSSKVDQVREMIPLHSPQGLLRLLARHQRASV